MCTLELSKTLMHGIHQNYIKTKMDSQLNFYFHALLFFIFKLSSFTYENETNDVDEDFNNNKDKFDFSDYPQSSKVYDE